MLVSTFNLSQSFNYTPYLFYNKCFKSEINSFWIWAQSEFVMWYIEEQRTCDGRDVAQRPLLRL